MAERRGVQARARVESLAVRVAVLGASGFIGIRLVEIFHLTEMATIRPVVRSVASLASLSRFDLECRLADARDQAALRRAFAGCEVVVHSVAGDRNLILGSLTPSYRAAQEAGVRRIVYLSTASVHGQAPAPGTNEASPLRLGQPIPYNNAKVLAERHLLRLRRRGVVEVVILRPGIVVGPRSFWVASFAEALLTGQAYLVDRGEGVCNCIYVDNLVHAISLALTTPAADGQAFLLGEQERVKWVDLYRPIAEALGFDLEEVPEVPVPDFGASWADRWQAVRSSALARRILDPFPISWRQSVAAAVRASRTSPSESPWTAPAPPALRDPRDGPPLSVSIQATAHQSHSRSRLHPAHPFL